MLHLKLEVYCIGMNKKGRKITTDDPISLLHQDEGLQQLNLYNNTPKITENSKIFS